MVEMNGHGTWGHDLWLSNPEPSLPQRVLPLNRSFHFSEPVSSSKNWGSTLSCSSFMRCMVIATISCVICQSLVNCLRRDNLPGLWVLLHVFTSCIKIVTSDGSLSRSFLKVMFSVSNLERWGNISPRQRAVLSQLTRKMMHPQALWSSPVVKPTVCVAIHHGPFASSWETWEAWTTNENQQEDLVNAFVES